MSKPGDEPAYPVVDLAGDLWCCGLTKRELFAAMAMQGYNANASESQMPSSRTAELSIQDADALLDELAKDATPDLRCSHRGCNVPATRQRPNGQAGWTCGNHDEDKPREATQ